MSVCCCMTQKATVSCVFGLKTNTSQDLNGFKLFLVCQMLFNDNYPTSQWCYCKPSGLITCRMRGDDDSSVFVGLTLIQIWIGNLFVMRWSVLMKTTVSQRVARINRVVLSVVFTLLRIFVSYWTRYHFNCFLWQTFTIISQLFIISHRVWLFRWTLNITSPWPISSLIWVDSFCTAYFNTEGTEM